MGVSKCMPGLCSCSDISSPLASVLILSKSSSKDKAGLTLSESSNNDKG